MSEEKTLVSPLREETITLRPVAWFDSFLYMNTGATHLPGSFTGFMGVPKDSVSKQFVEPLNQEERDYFATLGYDPLELKANNPRGKSFWSSFRVVLREGESLILRINNPDDFLRYAFLKAQKEAIAPSWEHRKDKKSYTHAFVSASDSQKEKVSSFNKQQEAFIYIGSIRNSTTKLKNVLSVYYKDNGSNKNIPLDASQDWYIQELSSIIADNVDKFLRTINDDNLNTKSFIMECLTKDILFKEGKNQYKIPGYDETYSFGELVDYLNDKVNQTLYGKLLAQLKATKEEINKED